MSYDETLAERVRAILGTRRGLVERRMFGGLSFLLDGAMCCGVLGTDLVVRVGPERYQEALARPHARAMDFTGRPMTGFVYVEARGLASQAALRRWVDLGAGFVATLRSKRSRRRQPRRPARGK